jgi:hypothetical protein
MRYRGLVVKALCFEIWRCEKVSHFKSVFPSGWGFKISAYAILGITWR